MKYLATRARRFCAFLIGLVYFLSGVLKLMDPTGAMLVMKEYFAFLHLGFLDFSAMFFGFAFAFAETITGAALITGVFRKITAIAAFSLQGLFTLLTLVLLIFNPQMDCGCFGEAFHLTHLQSFIKNVVLSLLLVGAFVPFREFGTPKVKKYYTFALVAASSVIFGIWSLINIPLVDYTPFKMGTILQSASEDVFDEDIYEAEFIYEKDGRQEVFTLGHLPDSTWTFVDSRTVLKEGFKDNVVVLSFHDEDGNYEDSLAADGRVMVISIYDDISQRRLGKVSDFVQNAAKAGFHTLVLTTPQVYDQVGSAVGTKVYESDYKTLISLNRSNGGVTCFSDGYLIRKWSVTKLPSAEDLDAIRSEDEAEIVASRSTEGNLIFQGFLLYVFAVMLLL